MHPKPNIRFATLKDTGEINHLLGLAWFTQHSEAGWKWLFEDNPAQGEIPPGIVSIGKDGDLNGFVGCCIKRFSQNGETLTAMTGHSLVAHPNHLSAGFRLMVNLLHQKVGFGTYTLNNNEIAARIYPRISQKAGYNNVPIFGQAARMSLQWITNPALQIQAGLKRRYHIQTNFKTARNGVERFSTYTAPPTDKIKLPKYTSLIADHHQHETALSLFWSRLSSNEGIFTYRDKATLDWILSNPDAQTPPIFITYDRGDGIEGWLIGLISKESEIAPPILSIIDLIALPESQNTILPELISAARKIASKMKLMKVHLPYASQETVKALENCITPSNIKTTDYAHAHGCFYPPYRVEEFEKNWSPTPLDGDFSFCLRPMPIR
ncbi:hypothetical protein [Hirschia baltica]|uniref:Uncharacterized protein n=1 Tax=Hirschia baltica (strain ATCC 49814 / DSM 5838 / IFAM 1418) TaxID=582402 RepID=C6XKT8_HIRBI|nr:hypothetical protein [Hirschia baltica]ACT59655.1 hypothetical protein Hbal_1971 [Hirschia baltica ATCC 49814]